MKFSIRTRIIIQSFSFLITFAFVNNVYSQCGFQATCPNTNYLNFGMGSNSDRNTIEYDNFCSSYHSTVVRTANGTYKTWGEGLANDGIANVLAPIEINSTNYPALTGQILKAHLASIRSGTAQGIVLTTTGLFAWGVEGTIIHQNLTTSNTFQKITVGGNAQGLPAGVAPTDVKMIFTTYKTMVITTCSGDVWVLTHQGENTGTGLTGALSAANAVLWYKVTTSAGGNPALANVVAVRGNQNTMFALTITGELYTWGTETYLGNNTAIGSRNRATLMTNPNGNSIKMIGVTRDQSNLKPTYYVLNTDGNLYSVGGNNFRQIGDWSTTDRLGWVQPRYTSLTGPVMNNIRWVSPNEHDHAFAAVNVLTADSTNYNWGESNGLMLGRAVAGAANPAIPDGITSANKILAVETGGHTSMLVKKCEDYFGYVGHRINGSMGDGTANTTNEDSYTFATAVVFICGATNLDVSITGAPTFGAGGLYCNGSSVDLIPSPTGGVLTLLSGPATLNGTIMNFNGTGNTTINVQYAVTVPGCPISKTTAIALQTEDCPPIGVTLTGTTTIAENAAGVATLTATLSAAASSPTTVTLTYSGTASGVDYTSSSVTITIPAGSTTGTVTIDPTDDVIFEGNETVIADITNVTGGDGATETGTQTATVTITDDETTPTVTLSGTTTIAENAAGVATLTATQSVATTTATTVSLTYSGTSSGADYAASSTTITIPAGSTTGTVTIDPTDDVIFEGNETVIADITNVTGGNGATESGTQTATVTITDDETTPTVTLSGTTTIAENAAGVATLTAIQSVATTTATTVTLTYTGTASGADYSASSTTITIPAGSTTGTVTIDPTDDAIFEGNETVIADITNVTGGNGATESGTQTATVTITDDETTPTVTLTGTTTIAENAAGVATLTATLSVATTTATTVTLTYTGTASGADYSASSTTITIPAGSTTGTVTIDPTDDVIFEGNETVIADITNVTGGNGAIESGAQTATVTITDDETTPTVTLSGTTTIAENAAGVATLTATLSVATTTATTVTLTYTGTTAGTDYAASSTTITIPAGSTTGTVTIDPTDDVIFEGNETVIADITNVTGGNGAIESGAQTATVTIIDLNLPPTANDNSTTTNEDTPVVLTSIQSNDTDSDGNVVTSTIDLDPATPGQQTTLTTSNGIWTLNTSTGDVSFTPSANFNGTATITYAIQDNGGLTSNVANLTVITNAINDSPNAFDDVASTNEDTPVVIDVTNNDTDTDGAINDASVTIVTNPTNGTLTVNPTTGEVTYTPNGGFNGTDSFTYSVCDNGTPLPAQCDQATVTVTVNAVNDVPNAVDDAASTNEDTPVVIDVTNNDTDTDGSINDASVTIVSNPTNGTVTVNPTTGEVTYTPNAGFNGADSFTYSVCDNGTPLPAQCDQATVTVTVNAVNDVPNAVDDAASTNEDTAVLIDVTSNDTDTDGSINDASVTIVTNPTNGTVTVNPTTGEVTYTPNAGFNGTDSFTYSVCDNGTPLPAQCDQATVTVTVNAVNDAPNAVDDVASTNEDTAVVIDVTTNDTDTDGSINDASVTIVSNPTNGTVTVNPTTGEVTYTPNAGFNGTDSFTYSVCDNGTPLPAQCDQATVTVTVNSVNDVPNAVDDAASTNEDTPVLIDVTNNDTDTDGSINDASVTIVSNPTNGTVTVNPTTGEVTYTPNAGFNGTDSFTYSVCDNGTPLPAQCDQATVTVTVNAVNDPPVVDNDSNTIAEDGGSATGDLTDTGDSDPDGTSLTINTTPVDGPNNGTITINADGTYSYTPNAGFNGQDTIVVSVCDNGTPLPAICVNDTLIITVTPINDAPNAVDDITTTNEDTAVLIDVTSNDTDTDGSINDASVTIVTNPTNGTVTVNPTTGEVTYTPNAGFNGTDSFTYSVCDNGTPLPAQCDQATVTVTVNAVNDPPVVDNDANTIAEDGGSATGDLTDTGDSDPDGTTLTVNTTPVDGPNNGTITINSDGTYSYTPNAGFNGQDTIVVSVCDSGTPLPEICVNDTLIITVTPVNDAPNATLDVASTYENISVTVIVVSNDTDTDGNIDESSLTLVDQPTNGSATVNATTGEITYTPNNGFTGIDTLIYQICDDGSPLPSACDTAMVVITVLPCVTDLTADCDGDGVTNGDEIDPNSDGTPGPNGTNPSDPCSFDLTNQSVVPSQAWLNADCDGDGVTNSDEIDPDGDGSPGPNGTNPNNPCSLLLTDQSTSPSQQWLIADCDGDGVTNGEEVDPDGDGTPGPNGTNPIDPCSYATVNQDFSTVDQIWLDADCDGDGVTNGEEIDPDGDGTPGPNGTNPNDPCSFNLAYQDLATVSQAWLDADCDGDGVTNGEEIDPDGDGTPGPNGTNPTDPCSFNFADQDLATVSQAWLDADCDGDGVTNGEEVDPDGDGTPGPNGTNPNDPCSFNFADQDLATVSQAWLDADCDGDGVTNGEEVDPDGDGTPGPNGTNPTDPCSFIFANQDLATVSQAWLDADCDGDGVTNGQEVDPDGDGTPGPNGTNPTDPCSFNFANQDLATVSQAWLDADCDGDGVTNGEEVDPDGDGTLGPNGTNPTDPCSFDAANQDLSTVSQAWLDADCDGDGVSNGDEIDPDGDGTLGPNGTNPSDPCSFNVADQDLAIVGQAWLDVDCDGDGVTNGDEIDPNGDGTIGPNETDPNDPCSFWFADQTLAPSQAWLDADCDGDGITNGEEVSGGSNPLNPCDPNTCDSDITIPQAFTPDGDNTNETFVITGIENYPKNKLIVFNRWGNEVYYEEGYNNTWDGTPNRGIIIGNDKLPTSTYYYILDLNGDGATIYKGYVYLKR